MVISLLLAAILAQDATGRRYHEVTIDQLAEGTRWTHVCVTGPVVYRRKQKDGDWHVTLDNGQNKVVLEIIPLIPVEPPSRGDVVKACGISRRDTHHAWGEVHPVESITVIRSRKQREQNERRDD